jgi:hypothetical protein
LQFELIEQRAALRRWPKDKWHATMSVNADQLKAAPEYKYSGK